MKKITLINVTDLICLWCGHLFSTLKNEKEIVRCPKCGSANCGKQEHNFIPDIKINPPTQQLGSRW